MSVADSRLAVTKFYVATLGLNARAQGVPFFALTYFKDDLVKLVAEARDAAKDEFDWDAYRRDPDGYLERLRADPDVTALLDGEEP